MKEAVIIPFWLCFIVMCVFILIDEKLRRRKENAKKDRNQGNC